jgi:hypothetical protein
VLQSSLYSTTASTSSRAQGTASSQAPRAASRSGEPRRRSFSSRLSGALARRSAQLLGALSAPPGRQQERDAPAGAAAAAPAGTHADHHSSANSQLLAVGGTPPCARRPASFSSWVSSSRRRSFKALRRSFTCLQQDAAGASAAQHLNEEQEQEQLQRQRQADMEQLWLDVERQLEQREAEVRRARSSPGAERASPSHGGRSAGWQHLVGEGDGDSVLSLMPPSTVDSSLHADLPLATPGAEAQPAVTAAPLVAAAGAAVGSVRPRTQPHPLLTAESKARMM